MKKWDFTLAGYQDMNYFCVADTFEEALAKARKKAQQLKDEYDLKTVPEVMSIKQDRGTFID